MHVYCLVKRNLETCHTNVIYCWQEILDAVYSGEPDVTRIPDSRNKVRVFVSSTFTDTKVERNNLMKGSSITYYNIPC